jgi:hypothetical protein
MVVTILPPPPRPPKDNDTSTCSEVSHVAHEHNGQCKNHGALNGGAPGAKNSCFGPERPIEHTIAQENHAERDTHRNYTHNAVSSHNILSKSNHSNKEYSKNEITQTNEDFPTEKTTNKCNHSNDDSPQYRYKNIASYNRPPSHNKYFCHCKSLMSNKSKRLYNIDISTNEPTSECNTAPNPFKSKHKIETYNDNPSIPNRFSAKSNYCNNEYPTSKTSNQLYNINKSTSKSNYTIETKPSIPIESSRNRSANSYFNNESYLNNEPSSKHKDFLYSPAHPTSKCNNSDANKPIRLSESTSNNKFFNEEPSDRNHNKKSSPTNRNKDISKNALHYTSSGGVETSAALWPDYRPHHFKEGTDGNVYFALRFPQMTWEFLMARPLG